jgi:hypothetical protein
MTGRVMGYAKLFAFGESRRPHWVQVAEGTGESQRATDTRGGHEPKCDYDGKGAWGREVALALLQAAGCEVACWLRAPRSPFFSQGGTGGWRLVPRAPKKNSQDVVTQGSSGVLYARVVTPLSHPRFVGSRIAVSLSRVRSITMMPQRLAYVGCPVSVHCTALCLAEVFAFRSRSHQTRR